MNFALLADLDHVGWVPADEDCRGWPLFDGWGRRLGTVSDLVVDLTARRVAWLVLDSGDRLPASEVLHQASTVVVGATYAATLGLRDPRSVPEDRNDPPFASAGAGASRLA